MKNFLILLLVGYVCAAQAQTCEATYALLKAGTHLEYTTYNKKGEADLTIKQVCQNVETRNDTLVAMMNAKGVNPKGEETYARDYTLKCLEGTVFMSMQSVMPTQQGAEKQGSGMEVEIEGGDMAYPAVLQLGLALPDAEMTVRASTGGMQLMKMRYLITNRKVESAEKLTTKAGTFDCMKITYDLEMNLLGKKTYHTAQWVAKNVGLVKSETYDKKGAVENSMVLTLFEK
ncbi:MAG: hypothetical protein ABIO24_07950 [Saprospiraceae bacterium]